MNSKIELFVTWKIRNKRKLKHLCSYYCNCFERFPHFGLKFLIVCLLNKDCFPHRGAAITSINNNQCLIEMDNLNGKSPVFHALELLFVRYLIDSFYLSLFHSVSSLCQWLQRESLSSLPFVYSYSLAMEASLFDHQARTCACESGTEPSSLSLSSSLFRFSNAVNNPTRSPRPPIISSTLL